MIRLIDLTKTFNGFPAVDRINLEVKKGEIFCFVGPNGAGKTTTIKMMVGLLRPTSGRVLIGGHDIVENPTSAKKIIGYIPDRPFLYEKLTGREFLRFVAGLYGEDRKIIEERIDRLLDLFELRDWEGELIEGYSHGMRQRLTISAALLHSPEIIIVDEPMVGLDPKGVRLIKRVFRAMSSKGTTIFMTTHTLSLAEEVGVRIGIIHQGKLIAIGTMDELRAVAKDDGRLEDIFLRLTGGEDLEELMEVLR